jgi:hypothetical protein
MIEQTEFSQMVELFLREKFPEFLSTIKYHEDHSFDCSLKSPTGQFSMWIATHNSEITLGLEDPDKTSACHTHISCYEREDVAETFQQLEKLVNDVFTNRRVFYHSNLNGFSWSDDIVRTITEKRRNEMIEYFTWNGEI